MLGRNGIAGLVCLAISVWLLLLTRGLPPAAMVPIGPAFYPRVVLSLMAFLSALLVTLDLIEARRQRPGVAVEQPAGVPEPGHPNYALVLATFAEFFVYILALPELGFRVSTLLFAFGLQITLQWPASWKRWLLVLVVAIGTTAACVLAFERYLLILLPRGNWTGM